MPELDRYRERYLNAIRSEMANRKIELYKDIAPLLNTTDKTISAISSHRQFPTVQHGIDLCRRFGYSANWLFLGKGEKMQSHQATLNEILRVVKEL